VKESVRGNAERESPLVANAKKPSKYGLGGETTVGREAQRALRGGGSAVATTKGLTVESLASSGTGENDKVCGENGLIFETRTQNEN